MTKHEIKHRWTEAVLFACDVPGGMESGLHARHALKEAVEAGADLTGADLRGAKWCDGVVINKTPVQLSGLHWDVIILDEHMKIGCELHKLSDWAGYDDKRIAEMDGREALRFWRTHKDALLAIAKSAGRGA